MLGSVRSDSFGRNDGAGANVDRCAHVAVCSLRVPALHPVAGAARTCIEPGSLDELTVVEEARPHPFSSFLAESSGEHVVGEQLAHGPHARGWVVALGEEPVLAIHDLVANAPDRVG